MVPDEGLGSMRKEPTCLLYSASMPSGLVELYDA
jgi:hypothetical protein